MKLSTKGRYGLRALIDLAQYSEDTPVSITEYFVPAGTFGKISGAAYVHAEKAGLVKSIRGAAGGYILAKPADEISVGDVLRALEGSLEPVECAGLDPEGGCKAADSCVTKYVWKRINESINHTVDEIMLSQLVEESRKKNCERNRENREGCRN